MLTSFQLLDKILKFCICPFFFFLTFIALNVLIGIVTDSFKINYYESIGAIAIGTIYIAPIMLIVLTGISLLMLRAIKKLELIAKESFLILWGIGMGIVSISLFFVIGWIEDILRYLF